MKILKRIIYIGYYDKNNSSENRNYVLAATNKMDYIIGTLEKIGYDILILSASQTKNQAGVKTKIVNISDKVTLKLPKSLGNKNKFIRLLDRFIIKLQIAIEILRKTKKNDNVLVYHSLGYMKLIKILKKIRKFHLILEVEEIYGDVSENEKLSNKELNFFKCADAYIFPTELLNEKINAQEKPYSIVYGTYQVEKDRQKSFDDQKIHCVYAGTFDPRKGGVFAAIESSKFLDDNYHLHILGFGNSEELEYVKKEIADISLKTKCIVTFDGLLKGEKYIEFLQKCNIGLSTQIPGKKYNDTSFPSKILSYMSNGLRVVSVRIKAIERAEIGKYLYYYNSQIPEDIAKAIKSVDLNDDYNGRSIISELDKRFQSSVVLLFFNK